MMATLVTAALTVIGFIIGQVSEGQYKWDEDISLEYTSGFMTGTISISVIQPSLYRLLNIPYIFWGF